MAVDINGQTGRRGVHGPGSRSSGDFEPIQPLRAHEYVAEQIRRHISLRLIRPGQALPPERELALTFGVGRPTIQQALTLLDAEGLVETRRGRRGGTFVAGAAQGGSAIDEVVLRLARHLQEVEELLAYRCTIEPAVARLAAVTRAQAGVEAMKHAIQGMGNAQSEPEYMRYDTAFHIAMAEATANRYLVRDVEEIRVGLNDAMTLLPESETWHRSIGNQHLALLAAVESGYAKRAGEVARVHVSDSERSLRAVLHVVRPMVAVTHRRTGRESKDPR